MRGSLKLILWQPEGKLLLLKSFTFHFIACWQSGFGQPSKKCSTSFPAYHTASFGLTDRKSTFEGGKTKPKKFGVMGILCQNTQICKALLPFHILSQRFAFSLSKITPQKNTSDFGYI